MSIQGQGAVGVRGSNGPLMVGANQWTSPLNNRVEVKGPSPNFVVEVQLSILVMKMRVGQLQKVKCYKQKHKDYKQDQKIDRYDYQDAIDFKNLIDKSKC